jgi:hypothetical protein
MNPLLIHTKPTTVNHQFAYHNSIENKKKKFSGILKKGHKIKVKNQKNRKVIFVNLPRNPPYRGMSRSPPSPISPPQQPSLEPTTPVVRKLLIPQLLIPLVPATCRPQTKVADNIHSSVPLPPTSSNSSSSSSSMVTPVPVNNVPANSAQNFRTCHGFMIPQLKAR